MRRRGLAVAFVALVCVLQSACSASSDADLERFSSERESLRGIKAVCVVVEKPHGLAGNGLTREDIQTTVELRLRSAGIRIPSQNSAFAVCTPDGGNCTWPMLYVQVAAVEPSTTGLAYVVNVRLDQEVVLRLNPRMSCFGATWRKAYIGVCPKSEVRAIQETVADFVDKFANDFLAANQKPASLLEDFGDKTTEQGGFDAFMEKRAKEKSGKTIDELIEEKKRSNAAAGKENAKKSPYTLEYMAKHPPPKGGVYLGTSGGHWIDSVSDDGRIVVLEDDSTWEVSPLDRIDTALWLPVTDIVVTTSDNPLYPHLLVNKDDSETAEAKLLPQQTAKE